MDSFCGGEECKDNGKGKGEGEAIVIENVRNDDSDGCSGS
jgi:hypothetical protein